MPLVVVFALLLVPIVEIFVIVQVGQAIGAWPTIALLIADSVLGAWLVRREGRRAWSALRQGVDRSMSTGHMPARELADGALILVGGTLLLTPGFLSDVLGFFLVLPFTRPLARRLLLAFATRWFVGRAARVVARPPGPAAPGQATSGRVVQGEVLDDEGPGHRPRP